MGLITYLGLLSSLFAFAWAQEKVFNVKDFGAVADGKTDSTEAFLDAWTGACAWEGAARVLVPEGTFLLGPITFKGECKGSMVFEVSGVVQAPGLDKFPTDLWIEFKYVNGLLITGGGTFDGQGAAAWAQNDCLKNSDCRSMPISLRFTFLKDSTIENIKSLNSKNFHMNVFACTNLKMHGITISAPGDSVNTDGIHMGSVNGVEVTDSVIGTGDDCISIGSGCTNVTIANVVCGPGHGISIGSLGKSKTDKDVSDVHVRNCTFKDTTNGVRIKTWEDSISMSATRFTFEDINMDNVFNPIIIDQKYCPSKNCGSKKPSTVQISDVSFKNIRGSSATQVAINLLCSEGTPCQDVKLQDINLEYHGTEGPAQAACVNVKGISTGQINPGKCI